MPKRPTIAALVAAGDIDGAVELAGRTDKARQALRDAGYTCEGLPVRPPCSCWFYEKAPSAHDRLLDLPDLPVGLGWSVILNAIYLDSGSYKIGDDPHFLFAVPEEIKTFFNIHGGKWSDTSGIGTLCQELPRIAEQARWGRLSERKMAMVHGVPGLDPDHKSPFVNKAVAS